MPKMKTKKCAAKRFSKTGTGKLKRNHMGGSHILSNKNPPKHMGASRMQAHTGTDKASSSRIGGICGTAGGVVAAKGPVGIIPITRSTSGRVSSGGSNSGSIIISDFLYYCHLT